MADPNYKLNEAIVSLSVADNWDEAHLEWRIEDVYWEEEPDTCLCGNFPINEMCILRNVKNGEHALVGNVCVKQFGLPSGKIFDALRRVTQNETKPLNPAAIEHTHAKGWINDWERGFYFETWRKRNLTSRRLAKRVQINRMVLRRIRNAK